LPVEKCVTVVPLAPEAGNVIAAFGLTLPPDDAAHPVERATFTRA
jgi:hypothetical protein